MSDCGGHVETVPLGVGFRVGRRGMELKHERMRDIERLPSLRERQWEMVRAGSRGR